MVEFNLSDFIEWSWSKDKTESFESIDIEQVKEFIRLLKQDINNWNETAEGEKCRIDFIDKLAGERLHG